MSYHQRPPSDLPEALNYSDLPETAVHESPQLAQPEKIVHGYSQVPLHEEFNGSRKSHGEELPAPSQSLPSRRICGFTPRISWSATALATIIVVGAAVGGGVGATSHERTKPGPGVESISLSSSSTSVTSPLPTTFEAATSTSASMSTNIPSITTTQIQESGFTLLRDCPSSNGTSYSYGGATSPMVFRKFCSRALTALPNTTSVDTNVVSLDLCIEQCAMWNVKNQDLITKDEAPLCNTVCWRNGDPNALNDYPGHCWGWRYENNTDGSLGLTEEGKNANCDSAALINQQVIVG
ncbi:hypothetical protein B0A48_16539 [Cryoendolithus antarcticus]|uniref:Uncharacterized protein n=1 Tax=Cryoendolithus antarcticus TaxID=1507870 RepID=A0A1V8SEV9_9PEZI|nr:hypothetical protein B0A48_16539 [Cryoendolithus antarcticus]